MEDIKMDINKWLVLREIHKPLFMGISRIYSEIKGGNTFTNRGYNRSSCRVLGKLGINHSLLRATASVFTTQERVTTSLPCKRSCRQTRSIPPLGQIVQDHGQRFPFLSKQEGSKPHTKLYKKTILKHCSREKKGNNK